MGFLLVGPMVPTPNALTKLATVEFRRGGSSRWIPVKRFYRLAAVEKGS